MEPPVDGAHQRMSTQAGASADGNDAHEHQHEQPVVVSPVENDVADAGHYSPDDYQRHGAEPVHQRPHDRPGYAALRPLHAEYDGGLSAVEPQVVPNGTEENGSAVMEQPSGEDPNGKGCGQDPPTVVDPPQSSHKRKCRSQSLRTVNSGEFLKPTAPCVFQDVRTRCVENLRIWSIISEHAVPSGLWLPIAGHAVPREGCSGSAAVFVIYHF